MGYSLIFKDSDIFILFYNFFMGFLIFLMKTIKDRKIIRSRRPNLFQPGLKFDSANDLPSYFDKVTYNFKLL